jgi:hypothetical protein
MDKWSLDLKHVLSHVRNVERIRVIRNRLVSTIRKNDGNNRVGDGTRSATLER